tara:strand:+ start:226 stop:939 length:714 start_codon:yes stop_codon:yes gene_type:complete
MTMNKKLVLGTLVASFGMLSLAGGCSVTESMDTFKGLSELQEDKRQEAIQEGVPREQLDKLMASAVEWIAKKAPNDPGVANSSYKKVFVIGGTLNESNVDKGQQSVSDSEVNIRTRKLFTTLRNESTMEDNFVFFDRTTDFGVDLGSLTGNLDQYGDPLGRGNNAKPATYDPKDIYLVKLSFEEIQKLQQKPATIAFTLTATIEWGGSPGRSLYSNIFESQLVFDKKWNGGKWIPAE